MTRQEIIGFLRANEAGFLATVEDGEPRVRGMAHYITTDGRIIYHSGTMKDLSRQIQGEPAVEMCVFDPASMLQVRVRGKAVVLNDKALADEIIEARPFLKQMLDVVGYEKFLVFELTSPKASTWTMETNFASKEWVDL